MKEKKKILDFQPKPTLQRASFVVETTAVVTSSPNCHIIVVVICMIYIRCIVDYSIIMLWILFCVFLMVHFFLNCFCVIFLWHFYCYAPTNRLVLERAQYKVNNLFFLPSYINSSYLPYYGTHLCTYSPYYNSYLPFYIKKLIHFFFNSYRRVDYDGSNSETIVEFY